MQAVITKQKRGGGIGSRYYRAGLNGPPSSVSDDKVTVSLLFHCCWATPQLSVEVAWSFAHP